VLETDQAGAPSHSHRVAIRSASTSDQELKPLVLKLRGLIIRQGLVRDTRDVDKQP
jgi:hypothetical protein